MYRLHSSESAYMLFTLSPVAPKRGRPIDRPEHPRSLLGDSSAPPVTTTTTTKTADTRAACLVVTLASDSESVGATEPLAPRTPKVSPGSSSRIDVPGEPPHHQERSSSLQTSPSSVFAFPNKSEFSAESSLAMPGLRRAHWIYSQTTQKSAGAVCSWVWLGCGK